MERRLIAKYVVMCGCLITAFMNLVSRLNSGEGLLQILFYSGSLFFMAIFLIFVQNKWGLVTVFFLSGIFVLLDDKSAAGLSPALLFFGYSIYISDNKYFKYITYLIVSIMVSSMFVYSGASPTDVINVLIGYGIVFALNELIYDRTGGADDAQNN